MLRKEYHLKREDIPENYSVFHEALRNFFDINHYAIERKMIKFLHERTKLGLYDTHKEVKAFKIISESYIEEVERFREIYSIFSSNIQKQLDEKMKRFNQ